MCMAQNGVALRLIGLLILMLAWVACKDQIDDRKIPITTTSAEARKDVIQGRDLLERYKSHESRQYFQAAILKDSNFALAHYYLAQVLSTTKQIFEELEKAVALMDRTSEGERLMILWLDATYKNDVTKAAECCERLVAAYPQDERAHEFLATHYYVRREYDRAIEHYKKAVEIAPRFPSPYNNLGYAYSYLENYGEAEKALKSYTELIPDDPNPFDSYAELLLKMGKYDESIAAYRKALLLDTLFLTSHIGIAANLLYSGKPDDALREVQKVSDKARDQGDRSGALTSTAMIYVDQGKTEQALQELEKGFVAAAAEKDTADMSNYLSLKAGVLRESGKLDEALAMHKESLKLYEASSLSPQLKDQARLGHHMAVAAVAMLKKDLKTAKAEAELYSKGAEATHDSTSIRAAHSLMGMIAYQEKNYKKGIDEFHQSNLLNPYNLYRLALAYNGVGDKTNAHKYCQKAAHFNSKLGWNYAFVRTKAAKLLAQL